MHGERQVGNVLKELKLLQDEALKTQSVPAPGTEPYAGTTAPTSPAPPVTGTVKALALLASFADAPPWEYAGYFDSLVFGETPPSLSHYFGEVSGGQFTVTTEHPPSSVGWLSLQKDKAAYVADLRVMLEDAIKAADAAVDFSRYDIDGDGRVDYLLLVHAGSGGEFTGSNDDIWSQTLTVAPVATADGVTIDTFTTVPEYWFTNEYGRMTVGVYVHEFGHQLGLPDLYDYGLDSKGIGDWGLMGYGMWNGANNRGESPSWPSAWSRVALGWVTPEVPTSDLPLATLPPVEQGGPVYYLWNNGAASSEFFLIENRQKLAGTYDAYLPSHGLLVWHVDETMPDNSTQIPGTDPLKHQDCNWPSHYRVALQQADGYMNLEQWIPGNDGDVGDPYPGNFGRSEFSPTSTPNSGSYRNCSSGVAVRNITEIDGDIQLSLEVSSPVELALGGHTPLSRVVPFRELPVTVTLSSRGAEATGVSAVLVSHDPLVVVTKPGATFPTIPGGEAAANDADPFLLKLEPLFFIGRVVEMELQVTADGGYSAVFPFQMSRLSLRWVLHRPGSSPPAAGL